MPVTGDSDEFGDRMKAYEAVETSRCLDRRLPIYARIDGRSFSTFTRGMARPFDPRMSSAMIGTASTIVEKTHARIGYVQSDEISLVWLSDAPESEPLFGGKVHKLTSVLASLAASAFQQKIRDFFDADEASELCSSMPHFDARVFSLPSKVEATNAILWRAMDARKNAVSMAARAHYSPKAMHLKDQTAMRAMLAQKGIDFETYPPFFKWGTFLRRVNEQRTLSVDELARIPEKHRPSPDATFTRSAVRVIQMPEFHRVSNRVEVVFDGAAPVEFSTTEQ